MRKRQALVGALGVAFFSGCSTADLVVTDVHYESWLLTTLQVKATVKNQGDVDAPASRTKLQVKPAGAASFTRESTAATPALASNQEVQVMVGQLSPTEIPSTGSGQCLELRACADDGNVVQEAQFPFITPGEWNNCKTNSICR